MGITHAKVSAIADDSAAVAAGEVVPSDWNNDHSITGDISLPANLTMAGSGSRITLHSTSGPVGDRTLFQQASGNTVFGAMPGAAGTIAAIQVYDRNDFSAGTCFGDIRITNAGTVQFSSNAVDATGVTTGTPVALAMQWKIGTLIVQYIDQSGNVGYGGATPGPASANYVSVYLGPDGTMLADSVGGANTSFQHNHNAHYSGGAWKYIETSAQGASQMVLTAGKFLIRTIPGGTAGATFLWNEIFCANKLGNFLAGYMPLGAGSPPAYGNGWRTFTMKGSATATDGTGTPGGGVFSTQYYDGSVIMELYAQSAGGAIRTFTNHSIQFLTNNVVGMTLGTGAAPDLTVVGNVTGANLSGTNTGDETATTIKSALGITTLSGSNTGDETTASVKSLLGITTLSGSNTGDETTASVKSLLGITTLSGSNTGDQTIALTGDVTGTGTGSFATAIKASVALTTPNIGAATGTSLAATGAITSSGGGIGYATGAGGTVTQLTSKSTGVTLSKLCGTITMNAAALVSAGKVSFTVTNTFMGANDVVHTQHDSGGTVGAYLVTANASAAGSFQITIRNLSTGSLSEALVIRFVIIKAAVA